MTLEERLDNIEALLTSLVERSQIREWYTTAQFAELIGRAEFSVREMCRKGRVRGEKRRSGRGSFCQWVISHDEYLRYQREGLRPKGSLRSSAEDTRPIPTQREAVDWYFLCTLCGAKWFSPMDHSRCPRCLTAATSAERFTPPWRKQEKIEIIEAAKRLN
jgi:hypothetical protein